MAHLTFKEYLESRNQLLKAIENTPISIVEYEVRKYCNMTIGENETEKELIGLRPKNSLIVEWRYDDINNPTPISIKFKGLKELDESDQFPMYWDGSKLKKWLLRHANEGVNHGNKI